jgi:hypothetical protein
MSLTVRAYNVLFGDCILVSWDEDDGEHHAWIDFGNFHNDRNDVFDTVYTDVLQRTGGRLDLLVITHRHLDHLEGFHVLRQHFRQNFTIDRLWHAFVTPAVDNQFQIAQEALAGVLPASATAGDGELARIFRNNFGAAGVSTAQRMDDILKTLRYNKAHPVHRQTALAPIRPAAMQRLQIEILAPESDSHVYLEPLVNALADRAALDEYFEMAQRGAGAGRGRAGAAQGRASAIGRSRTGTRRRAEGTRPGSGDDPFPLPHGTAASKSALLRLADFARLRRQLRTGGLDLLGAVDRTRNNTSIVLALTYQGKRLLFAGDAEQKSWEIMHANGTNLAATVVKVGHHGSINASPDWCFAKVLPKRLSANAAIISTDPTRFTGENPVPNAHVLTGWRGRLTAQTRLLRTDTKAVGKYVEVRVVP